VNCVHIVIVYLAIFVNAIKYYDESLFILMVQPKHATVQVS